MFLNVLGSDETNIHIVHACVLENRKKRELMLKYEQILSQLCSGVSAQQRIFPLFFILQLTYTRKCGDFLKKGIDRNLLFMSSLNKNAVSLKNAVINRAIQLNHFSFSFARHEYAVAEKNTVLATCRKLEEQLEDRGKQIQQYVNRIQILVVLSSLYLASAHAHNSYM